MKQFARVVAGLVLFWIGVAAQARTMHLYYTDPQGTVLAKTDAQGNILARYDYRPYGGVVSGNGPDGPGYTGHVQDPETGLIYMQQRYDDPLGRFPSPDPVGPSPGNVYSFNRYAYANNNPIVNIDPDGREDEGEGDVERRQAETDALNPKLGPNMAEASPFVKMPGESRLSFAFRQELFSTQACSAPGASIDYEKVEQAAQRDVASIHPKTHGNVLDDKPAEGYTLRDSDTGEVKKYGETTRGEGRFQRQRRYSKKFLKEHNVDYQKETSGTKREMHQWQHERIMWYRWVTGRRPPMNRNDY